MCYMGICVTCYINQTNISNKSIVARSNKQDSIYAKAVLWHYSIKALKH
jgi:hypothetical protein